MTKESVQHVNYLLRGIPGGPWADFRLVCKSRGVTAREALLRLIRAEVETQRPRLNPDLFRERTMTPSDPGIVDPAQGTA